MEETYGMQRSLRTSGCLFDVTLCLQYFVTAIAIHLNPPNHQYLGIQTPCQTRRLNRKLLRWCSQRSGHHPSTCHAAAGGATITARGASSAAGATKPTVVPQIRSRLRDCCENLIAIYYS